MTTDTKNTGGPAFPLQSIGPDFEPGYAGMTLRDWFAGQALEMAAKMSWDEDATIRQNAIISATWAYEFADAMLEARDQ